MKKWKDLTAFFFERIHRIYSPKILSIFPEFWISHLRHQKCAIIWAGRQTKQSSCSDRFAWLCLVTGLPHHSIPFQLPRDDRRAKKCLPTVPRLIIIDYDKANNNTCVWRFLLIQAEDISMAIMREVDRHQFSY
jgi:hypothetical protein